MASHVDPDQFSTPYSITPHMRRQPYTAILPSTISAANKIIVITGGGSGLGAAAAKVWAQAGAAGIVVTGRRLDRLEIIAKQIRDISPTTTAVPIATDNTSEQDVKTLFETIIQVFGRPADVILNSAGYQGYEAPIGELSVDEFWRGFEINLKGLYMVLHYFIASQPHPDKPVGTFIAVASGRAGLTLPKGSSYDISKLAQQRLIEHAQVEHPTLRLFTSMPGIVPTDMVPQDSAWAPFAHDHADLTGMQALWLSTDKADFLKGAMLSVNWDVDELVKAKEEIVAKKLLWTSWLPVVPAEGGQGLKTA